MDTIRQLPCLRWRLLWVATLLMGSTSQIAIARPPYKHALKKLYGARLNANLHQCSTCHMTKEDVGLGEDFDEENPPHNVFGVRLRELGEKIGEDAVGGDILSRLKAVFDEDTDGDGIANQLEILAGKHPGRAQSRPDEQELIAAHLALASRQREATGYAWEPFLRVNRPRVPESKHAGWVRTPIDAFVAAEYDRLSLSPTTEAAEHNLLRRLYLDLVGIPPTREQLRNYLADDSPVAYEQVVEQLLASPEYGQRWGRHWMDIWRYSDWAGWTDGGQIRDSQAHIWRWRDWIIDSLNADRPYNSMVQAMLAADELTPVDCDELRATGYLVRNYKMLSRETWMQDTVEHTCKAFLAITMNCARCHDHMYDPISQAEYYQFRAIFEPHNVRADRVANQPDVKIDGLTRAYDAETNAATYLFIKGDDRNPQKDRPIEAAVPAILGEKLLVTPVDLPIHAYYPGMLPLVRDQVTETAKESLNKARQDLEKAETTAMDASKLVACENATDADRGKYELAKQRVAARRLAIEAAEAELQSVLSRIAADDLKYATDAEPGATYEEAATKAGTMEREAKLIALESNLRQSEFALADAEFNLKANPEEAGLKKAATDAKQKLEQATKALENAKKKSPDAATAYTPLTTVYPQQSTGRRSGLAKWLTSRENPLTARVAVNHIWNRHFGRGLVPSVFDFGQNGKPPTHPALLDWLAAELMEPTKGNAGKGSEIEPWSMKHIHRLIVNSSVYRLSTQIDADRLAKDPDNEYLTRASTKRMEAEVVRDSVLFVADNLDLGMGGPDIDFHLGFQIPRRSLYFRHAAEKEMTFLKIFDAAAVTECYQRKSSVMPQQALAMINSELTISQSRRLVRFWKGKPIDDAAQFTRVMFEHILSRSATDDEVVTCVQFLSDCANRPTPASIAATPDDLSKPASDPALRARELLVHVLMNHHEFVSIY